MTKQGKILIIDDEEDILLSLRFLLKQHFGFVRTEHNPHHVPRLLRNETFDVVLLDMNFRKGDTSGEDGLFWLQKILELQANAHIVMMSAYGDIATAVEAVKKGAIDFIEKPWRNEKLLATIQSVYKLSQSQQEVKNLQDKQQILSSQQEHAYSEMIGQSAAMQAIFKTIEKVAKTDANVLILGENGTGKELVARAIHTASLRQAQIFVNVDLGAVPENLFESELFGHKKGAFTGAQEDRMGRFEAASQGTLFLDEIGNLSMPLQAKLLTVLQNREVRRVGTNQAIPIDVRLVAATNMPLYKMVQEHRFRQDLVYRINTVEIKLPPLRDRQEDIPLLAQHFLDLYARKYHKTEIQLAPKTLAHLQVYAWPGNIRELRHAVERAVILSESKQLQPEDFILQATTTASNDALQLASYNLEDIELQTIKKVLKLHQGNISKAAKELGLTRAALYRRMEKYGI